MRNLLIGIFLSLEQKAKEEYGRSGCVPEDHQSNCRLFRTFFGQIRHRLAQMKDG